MASPTYRACVVRLDAHRRLSEETFSLDWYFYPAIVAAGFVAGFINTLAGSGSLVTLPLLILMGLPANVANGTNRVAILLQNVVGVTSFRRSNVLDVRGAVYLGIPATVGAILGAQIAVNLNEHLMRRAIGVIMLVLLVIIIARPQRWMEGELDQLSGFPNWKLLILFFAIGIYGGFIQAGVGIFLLAGLVLGVGYDMVRANAVKVGIVLLFTVAALLVFIRNRQVNWSVGFILGMGNMMGAWIAAQIAVLRTQSVLLWMRRLLITIVAFAAANLLGLFVFLRSLIWPAAF